MKYVSLGGSHTIEVTLYLCNMYIMGGKIVSGVASICQQMTSSLGSDSISRPTNHFRNVQ